MSIKVMSAVWEHSRAKGSELLLLLAIADYADDEGNAFPSVTNLAKKIRMTQRGTQMLLRKLEKLQELSTEHERGPNGRNLYRVKTFQGHRRADEPSVTRGDEPSVTRGMNPSSAKPSLEPSVKKEKISRKRSSPPLSPQGESASFAAFWQLYPKKRAKQKAWEAWKKLKLDALQAVIMRSVEDHLAQWHDEQFIPHPATFLNQRRWEDDLTPADIPGARLSKAGRITAEASTRLLARWEREDKEKAHATQRTPELLEYSQHDE